MFFTVLGIPATLLHALRLTRLEKRLMPLIFLIGLLSLMTPLVRYLVNDTGGLYPKSVTDYFVLSLQKLHLVIMLSDAEVLAAFVAFCLPAFRPVIGKKLPAFRLTNMLPLTLNWSSRLGESSSQHNTQSRQSWLGRSSLNGFGR